MPILRLTSSDLRLIIRALQAAEKAAAEAGKPRSAKRARALAGALEYAVEIRFSA